MRVKAPALNRPAIASSAPLAYFTPYRFESPARARGCLRRARFNKQF